ncbi:MAG: hypothetical protein B1H04_01360 [Planctomycetales bacterium 4484_123]|nr:MAG: hypothetical protein B1H04_01360 [Planctomycetales bacterium 4484_123]
MPTVTVPWGQETFSLELPRDWTVQQTAQPQAPPASEDWPDVLARALNRPEGTPPLEELLAERRHGRVAIIVEDLTRHSPLESILRVVLRELAHARIGPENVELVFATGMHPPMSADQAASKVGRELATSFPWRCNPWRDRDAHAYLGEVRDGAGSVEVWVDRGVASADLRILIGSVSPHLQAGFGGGYKLLVPGCAHLQTIRQLHLSGVPRRAIQQVGQPPGANRMRRLIDAAGSAVDARAGVSFGIQYLLDASDRPAAIAAGDVAACHRMLVKKCAAAYGVLIDAPADVVIANAHPRDHDLWQSFKAIAHACWALRDNGVLICLARCPGQANMPTRSLPLPPLWVRRGIRLLGADTLASLLTRLVPALAGDAAFFVRLALRILQRHTVLMVSPALVQGGVKLAGLPLYSDPADAVAVADKLLPPGPKRVTVFPAGGVTYPIRRPRPVSSRPATGAGG